MDTSEKRIEALKKCVKLQEYWWADGGKRLMSGDIYVKDATKGQGDILDLDLPRIDQHLEILKEKGYFWQLENMENYPDEYLVILRKRYSELFDFTAPTLEQALDQACEFVLNRVDIR